MWRVLHGCRTARGCVEAEIVKRPEVGGASDDRIKDPSRQRKSASGWRLGREGTTRSGIYPSSKAAEQASKRGRAQTKAIREPQSIYALGPCPSLQQGRQQRRALAMPGRKPAPGGGQQWASTFSHPYWHAAPISLSRVWFLMLGICSPC